MRTLIGLNSHCREKKEKIKANGDENGQNGENGEKVNKDK